MPHRQSEITPLKRYVELTLIPSRDNLRHIRLNAKQLRIYRVTFIFWSFQVKLPFYVILPVQRCV